MNAVEKKETRNGKDIWVGKDAEGRKCYAISTPHKATGVSVSPSGTQLYYSLKDARQAMK